MPLRNIRIVLVRPRGGANVGAVARAMKNMGLHDLVLVRPAIVRTFWSKTMAVHAEDVLNRARRCDSLAEAVADCGLVVGTTCRGGSYREGAEPPRDVAIRMVTAARSNPVALVFGPEDHGLSNDDLKRCQQLISIPTDFGYVSLNLAQAVMVCCYELFLAAEKTAGTVQVLATAERVEFMFQRLQAACLSIGFLHADNPEHIMFAFRRFLGRAQMEERDVSILLGLARQIEWFGCGGWRTMAAKRPHPEGIVDKCESPLDTAPEKMGPTRGERGKPSEINMAPLTPSSRPLLAAYRGVPAGSESTISEGEGDTSAAGAESVRDNS